MIFNQVVIGDHPATSGYKLDFFVNGFNSTFASGSGQYTVGFPNFGVSGLGFRGLEAIFEPSSLLASLDILEGEARISGFLSGDFNNSGILNVKNIDVYTGSSESFACDTIDFSNRVVRQRVNLENTEDPFIVDLTSENIAVNGVPQFDKTLFYKVVPADFLIGRNESNAVSGSMLEDLPTIEEISGVESFVIERTTATDLFIETADNGVSVFPFIDPRSVSDSITTIFIKSDVPVDFLGEFIIKNDGRKGFIRFREESNTPLAVSRTLLSQAGITQEGNTLTVSNRENEDRTFNVGFEVDSNGAKRALAIEASS